MNCYECFQNGTAREAVGLCHHCSAGLCAEHACAVADPILVSYPVATTRTLPKAARILLCPICKAALEQLHSATGFRKKIVPIPIPA